MDLGDGRRRERRRVGERAPGFRGADLEEFSDRGGACDHVRPHAWRRARAACCGANAMSLDLTTQQTRGLARSLTLTGRR